MPPELLTSPNDLDQVTDRILSEHSRSQNSNKVQEVLDLRDNVYQTGQVKFHWNLQNIVKCTDWNAQASSSTSVKVPSFSSESTPQTNEYSYDVDLFMAVLPHDNDAFLRFWIRRGVVIHYGQSEGSEGTISALVRVLSWKGQVEWEVQGFVSIVRVTKRP